MKLRAFSIINDIVTIITLTILFSLSYNLTIYKDLNFLEKALNKSFNSDRYSSNKQIKEISIDEALNLIQLNDPVIIDARNESDYQKSKIKNAINIPAKKFEEYLEQVLTIPKDALIIIYCEGIHCNLSHQLAEKMKNFGFKNLNIMYQGIEGWLQKKLPVVKNEN
ncbi:MAG: rhodanese-like domain-containing protein [Ignavibacteria bacterium]|jgi:rhodanese-related sulfurtransferase|nr:rhodanese-like domain-containing protein [Ignavibacteria bacterium]MDH7527118.1 rhodanese-like domain-containing protein [Ignavibacteria bacterium]